jgi:hypothetical protein
VVGFGETARLLWRNRDFNGSDSGIIIISCSISQLLDSSHLDVDESDTCLFASIDASRQPDVL